MDRGSVEQHYRVDELAALLGHVTTRTVHRWIREGRSSRGRRGLYPALKLSRQVLVIPASAVNRLLKGIGADSQPNPGDAG